MELDDAGRARVRGERFGECGPDPAPLQLVRDLEPDVRGVTLPDEACDRRRSRIALDVRDEDVVTMVDARERFELRLGQMRLRGGEPHPSRLLSEPREHGRHRLGVPVSERPNDEAVGVTRLHTPMIGRAGHAPPRRCGPSF